MSDIFQFVKEQETAYAQEIEVIPNWNWCMRDHIRTSTLMKYGKFKEATNDLATKEPNKNIIYPLLNLRYRAEDIDMKDVVLYVDDPERYHLSFLIKKYHDEVYVAEHDLDTFFDETKEEKIDLGATLVRKGKNGPIMEPLESIAFCDQTDILSGPIGFKLFFSPEELYATSKFGWGDEKNGANVTLDELVTLAEAYKDQDTKSTKTKTPGKYVEVYRVHGVFPKGWLDDSESTDNERYVRQIHVIAFYKDEDGDDVGVTLYKKKEYENPFKIHLSGKKIRNRALGYGGVEELFDPQIWTNYSEIRKKQLLDAVSKVIRWTDDDMFANNNDVKNLDNNEVLTLTKGTQMGILSVNAPNVSLFNEWIREWSVQGQDTSGATDALLGKNPASGSPFALQNLVVQQGEGLHQYRRGKFATFISEIYMDWIIPDIAKSVTDGVRFLATLSPDEMEYVSDCVARNLVSKEENEKVLNGQLPYVGVSVEEGRAARIQQVKDEFGRGGNKKFLEILKNEIDENLLRVKVNVAGKQKDLASIVEKMTNVFRQVLANPAILQDPKAAKVFNKLIEYSGLDPIDFGYSSMKPQTQLSPIQQPAQPQPAQAQPSPVA